MQRMMDYKAGTMQRRRVCTPECKEGTALRLLRGESQREDSEGSRVGGRKDMSQGTSICPLVARSQGKLLLREAVD